MTEHCGSWPFCNKAPVGGERFCADHLPIMQKVAAELKFTLAGKTAAKEQAPKVERRMTQAGFQSQILKALADGPLTSKQLTAAIQTRSTNKSYVRARRACLDSGEVHITIGEPSVKLFYLDGQPEPHVDARAA